MPKVNERELVIDGEKLYAYNYPRPSVAVDCVVFGTGKPTTGVFPLTVLLIKRKNPPFQNHWALPGGFMNMDEKSITTARRELKEETAVEVIESDLSFVGVFDSPGRDARGRVVSLAYYTLIKPFEEQQARWGSDAIAVEWCSLSECLPASIDSERVLAFDHALIITQAWHQLRVAQQGKTIYSP